MAANKKNVDGDDLLYRFFQELFSDESSGAEGLPLRMLATMGIWLPLDVYHDWPILLPWVVRDNKCRGNKKQGIPDQWGSPNEDGYFRDDNSLVKALPRTFSVQANAPLPVLRGARMGKAFVASHIWREVNHQDLASRIALLNSFTPNLLWLPRQVSKLSDREGSIIQQTLQAMSWQIYRHAPVAPHLEEVVEEAWRLIPEPQLSLDLPALNWFESTARFFKTRETNLNVLIAALRALEAGEPLEGKVLSKRYTAGLPGVEATARRDLLRHLKRFLAP